MSRIAILAAAAALLGSTGLVLAQQPASHSFRHPALSGSSMESSTAQPAKTTADQFASEAEAKSHCRGDTVVWVNTKTHVYHFPGNGAFGHTKHGAFMCQADADRSGKFHAAKNEAASPAPASGSTVAPRR
jgi:hypothetical protein